MKRVVRKYLLFVHFNNIFLRCFHNIQTPDSTGRGEAAAVLQYTTSELKASVCCEVHGCAYISHSCISCILHARYSFVVTLQ